MDNILDLLKSDMGRQIISGVSQETNESQDKTAQVVSMALPLLMGAMKRNASSTDGASGLMNALSGKHDGSILDNLDDFFAGGVNDDQKIDGLGILGHVLGGSQDNVVGAISQKTGLDSGKIMQILSTVAPLIMGYLGKQKSSQSVQDSSGLEGLLGSIMGGQSGNQSMIESLLDGNNDGSILDDVAGMVLGGSGKSKGGLGSMLGGLFGK